MYPFRIFYAYANVHMHTQYRAFRKHTDVLAGYIAGQFACFISQRHGGPLPTIAHVELQILSGGGPSVSFEPMDPSLFHEGVHPPEPGVEGTHTRCDELTGQEPLTPRSPPQGGQQGHVQRGHVLGNALLLRLFGLRHHVEGWEVLAPLSDKEPEQLRVS